MSIFISPSYNVYFHLSNLQQVLSPLQVTMSIYISTIYTFLNFPSYEDLSKQTKNALKEITKKVCRGVISQCEDLQYFNTQSKRLYTITV